MSLLAVLLSYAARTVVPNAIIDLRYATSNNFVGVPMYPANARSGGLTVYSGEWWHFDTNDAYMQRPILDVPLN